MKTLALIIATSLATGTAALGQQTEVRGNASAESQTSVSADRRGANVANENRAQGGAAIQRDQGNGPSQQAAADLSSASEMNATLERSVDARRAKPGDEVTAKMNEELTTHSGMTIPRGSRLVGRVTEARPHARGEAASASQLGIVFDKAELPDGREVPMHATIQALAAARSQANGELGSASRDAGAFGSSQIAGGGFAHGGLGGGAIGGLGATGGTVVGSAAGNAGAAAGGAARLPRPAVGAATSGAGAATAGGGALLGSSASAVGGFSASGRWLAGSRGAFGFGDMSIASAAAGSAQGSLITSASRNVRLDGGTRLLLVGTAGATSR
jgi:hypothetical protein